ncbi:MAG: VOC family protein [Cytophagales bacterium]|nr:VOC family protein [Cytophagales bacterium]
MGRTKITPGKISPCLWFGNNAEEAVNFYVSLFDNSKITSITRYGKDGPFPEGTVLTIGFQLEGLPFLALNGGPAFQFNEAVSFVITCDTQDEIDIYWKTLSEGGVEQRCGWIKDRFGLSWQVVPDMLSKMMAGDPASSSRMMQALLKMVKLDIAVLQAAYES